MRHFGRVAIAAGSVLGVVTAGQAKAGLVSVTAGRLEVKGGAKLRSITGGNGSRRRRSSSARGRS
jgi:hypothetical protein